MFHVSFLKPYGVDDEDQLRNMLSCQMPTMKSREQRVDTIIVDHVQVRPNRAKEVEYLGEVEGFV